MTQQRFDHISVIAFDADDTLWDCQSHFDRVSQRMAELLAPWCTAETAYAELIATESSNLSLSGYGCKAYILSVLETAIRVSRQSISAAAIDELISLGYGLMRMPVPPLPEVETTLQQLSDRRKVVFTKGDLLNQANKVERSGLAHHFEHVEITADKTEREFLQLCQRLDIPPSELLMVGNSFKSDIAPALAIGAYGIHIPYHVTWAMEHTEEFAHECCVKIQRFSEILNYV